MEPTRLFCRPRLPTHKGLFSVTFETENPQSDHARGVLISFKFLKIASFVVILVAAGMAVWYVANQSPSGSTSKKPTSAVVKTIHLTYSSAWTAVSAKTVRGAPSDSIIVLKRKDKSGVLVVFPGGKAVALDTATSRKISLELARQYADYEFLRAAVVHLKAGKALFFTYLRKQQGDLHTITILPVGKESFIIETASPLSNTEVRSEIGTILSSATISSTS